jgi:hypothetical protein
VKGVGEYICTMSFVGYFYYHGLSTLTRYCISEIQRNGLDLAYIVITQTSFLVKVVGMSRPKQILLVCFRL